MGIKPERLLEVVAAVAKEARPHVEPHATLDSSLEKELGLDSLARVELVLRLEKEFGASPVSYTHLTLPTILRV